MATNASANDDRMVNWSSYMFDDIFKAFKPPQLGVTGFHDIEEKARKKFQEENNMGAFNYVFGSANTQSTDRFNREAFDKYRIIPRMMVDTNHVDLSTTIFGKKYPSPLIIGPVGVQGIIHPDADNASSRAAGKLNVPYVMSTASTRTIESVAESSGNGSRWYQLYWPLHDEVTESLLTRAKKSGFTVLVVTTDTPTLGWRPLDIETAYLPFAHGTGTAVGFSDPVFMARNGKEPVDTVVEYPYDPKKIEQWAQEGDTFAQLRMEMGVKWLVEANSGRARTWEELRILRKYWDGPIVLKGIQSVADAEKAVDYVEGIIVSNHGGRQVDGAVASLDALYKIGQSQKIRAAQESGKFTLLFDSGVRTGSDMIKAMVFGAQGVLLARPYMYGLALGGEAGVDQVIRSILADMQLTLKLSGYNVISDIWHKREVLEYPHDRL